MSLTGDEQVRVTDRYPPLTAMLTQHQHDRRGVHLVELIWSWTRLISFVAVFVIYLGAKVITAPVIAVVIACAILFVVAVGVHRRVRRRRIALDHRIIIVSESLTRLGGQLVAVRSGQRPAPALDEKAALPPAFDDGETWSLTDQERDDLDLHAMPVGVFGLLNRTSTPPGARRLDHMLNHPCLEAHRIADRQAAVRWLEAHPEARIRIMAAAVGQRRHEDRLDACTAAIVGTNPLSCPWPGAAVLRLWALVSGAAILGGIVPLIMGRHAWIFFGLYAVNLILFARLRPALSRFLANWSDMGPIVRAALDVLQQAAADLPREGPLGLLRERCTCAAQPRIVPRLCRLLDWLNIGGLIQILLNTLFLYDLQIAQAVVPLIVRHRSVLLEAWAAAAELEALCSLACFASEQPVRSFPEIVADKCLHIQDGTHPLILPGKVQANSVVLSDTTRVWVITGSNMSGKSTLLRMAGTCVLLAQMGSAVTAARMRLCPVRLTTDLRARDNLARNESYYLAEVRQLRRMIDPPASGTTLLGIIDEPFRGTNSEEQAAASMAVVQHLIASGQFYLVATHERQLTSLGSGAAADNHHFRESLEGEEMVFDYRLRPGPAVSRNAIQILRREGYPEPLVAHAAELMASTVGHHT